MAVAELPLEPMQSEEIESPYKIVARRFVRHKLALVGLFIIFIFILIAVFADVIMPNNPLAQNLAPQWANPSPNLPMGTDQLGRDVFSRLIFAARISLFVTITVNLFTEVFGTIVGAISGYYGGIVDNAIQRFVEVILTLPQLPLLLFFSAILRGIEVPGLERHWSSAIIIIVILSLLGWTTATLLVRGMVLSLREQEFTHASRSLGMGNWDIIRRHMIPNALSPVIVNATLGLGGVIVLEAALSFLGFGIQPPIPTWGNMLQEVQQRIFLNPWLAFYPGICIFLLSLSFNYVGDALRDALDPRLKR
ncbi:MAG TPA: ABC transporter permease [Ardenticatenaceae bacterium]|jgi:peptide/nickel transport system permease protein